MSEQDKAEVEQSPALRAQADPTKTNIEIYNQPTKMQVHESYRGSLKFTRVGEENSLGIRVTDNEGTRATARVDLENEEFVEFVEALNEVVEEHDL